MPGLVRGMVRTAAVVGTATATRNAVDRHQARRNAEAYNRAEVAASQSAPQPPSSDEDAITQLERLGSLKAHGVITEEEFAVEKAKILNRM